MMICNQIGLVMGVCCIGVAIGVGYLMGWSDPRRDDAIVTIASVLLLIADSAWRLPSLRHIHQIDPPTFFTSEGPILNGPQPVLKTLNVFLSGEKGLQYFWVVPGWLAATFVLVAMSLDQSR
jgi:hypothetical protein